MKRNLIDEMNSADDNRRNSLKNSPRGLHTSLEGGLDDVDLLAIGQGSPISDIIQRVLGINYKPKLQYSAFIYFYSIIRLQFVM